MAISYIAGTKAPTSYPASSNNTSTCNIAKPTGTASGDVMIAFIITANAIITAPAGWTLIHNYVHPTVSFVTNAYYRVAGGSEGTNYTFTDDNSNAAPMCGAIATFRGVDTANPINDQENSSTTGTDTVSTPSITTTATCLLLHFRASREQTGADVSTEPSFTTSLTTRLQFGNRGASTAYGGRLVTDGVVQVAPGTYSGTSFNANDVITASVERTIALRAADADLSASPTAAISNPVTANKPTPQVKPRAQVIG
ncbi:hypothetical protein [Streptomyces roseolus]|uniref:hypothetical protein n=1 Tax=Streptomyces roseolus TaxID=67358 RepID=UPI0016739FCC|nr:hypothetical protein [Streptomyces roseolus]GGR51961.1 hypothetical protein GCM10010282_51150 [Streptomyces roseolus]